MFRKKLKTGFSKKLIPIALLGETKNKKSNLERESLPEPAPIWPALAQRYLCVASKQNQG